MSARDLAATVRGALKQGILHMDEPRDALAALAVLEQQAADARGLRYSKQSWVEMGKLERLRADAAEARAVRAEEALRQARGLLSEWHTLGHVSGGGYNGTLHGQTLRVIAEADEALDAAGADTPRGLEACDCGSAQENHGTACRCDSPPSKRAGADTGEET